MAYNENEETIGYRVQMLRKDIGWSQKELATKIYVNNSQISRLESGETTNINIDMIISLAKLYHVSTDYLLGLTKISVPKSYDITELGLSEEAVKRLILRTIDVDVLNKLLEHKQFPKLCSLIRNYFDNTIADGIMARNELINLATEPLTELMSAEPEKRAEIIKDLSFLNSTKLAPNEADIEKIKSLLLAIIRDIKSEIAMKQPSSAVATTEAIQGIRDALPDKPQSELTIDDVSIAVAAYVGTVIPMNETSTALLQKLSKKIIEKSDAQK